MASAAETLLFELKVATDPKSVDSLKVVDRQITELEKSFQDFQERSEVTSQQLQNATVAAADAASDGFRKTGAGARVADEQMESLRRRASLAAIDLGRIAQDAPYGLIGIANNIEPAVTSVQRLRDEAAQAGTSALPILAKALTGPTGISVAAISAFAILESQLPKIQRFFGAQEKATKEAIEAYKEFFEVVRVGPDIEGFSLVASQARTLRAEVGRLQDELSRGAFTTIEDSFTEFFEAADRGDQGFRLLQPLLEAKSQLQESPTLEGVLSALGVRVDLLRQQGADTGTEFQILKQSLLQNRDVISSLSAEAASYAETLEGQLGPLDEAARRQEFLSAVLTEGGDIASGIQKQYQDLIDRQSRIAEVLPVDRVSELREQASFLESALEQVAVADLDLDEDTLARFQSRLEAIRAEIEKLTASSSTAPDRPRVPLVDPVDEIIEQGDVSFDPELQLSALAELRQRLAVIQRLQDDGIFTELEADLERLEATRRALQRLQQEAEKGKEVDAEQVQVLRRRVALLEDATDQQRENNDEISQARELTARLASQTLAAGAQAAFEPLYDDIENGVFRAITQAITQAVISAAAQRLFQAVLGTTTGGSSSVFGALLGGFYSGGYTGRIPASQVAGVVHGGEVVMENAIVQGQESDWMALRSIAQQGVPIKNILGISGFATGGYVGVNQPRVSAPSGRTMAPGDVQAAIDEAVGRTAREVGRQMAKRPVQVHIADRVKRKVVEDGNEYRSRKNPRR